MISAELENFKKYLISKVLSKNFISKSELSSKYEVLEVRPGLLHARWTWGSYIRLGKKVSAIASLMPRVLPLISRLQIKGFFFLKMQTTLRKVVEHYVLSHYSLSHLCMN